MMVEFGSRERRCWKVGAWKKLASATADPVAVAATTGAAVATVIAAVAVIGTDAAVVIGTDAVAATEAGGVNPIL